MLVLLFLLIYFVSVKSESGSLFQYYMGVKGIGMLERHPLKHILQRFIKSIYLNICSFSSLVLIELSYRKNLWLRSW